MKNIRIGTHQPQPAGFKAFIPDPYPPQGLLELPAALIKKSSQATMPVGKLDGITRRLPNADFFLLMYLKKDAASSSQIEGTVATMVDAIEAEVQASTNLPADVDDILHYLKALHYGMDRIEKDEFPLSLRLVKELHYQLLHQARASHFSNPGEFRSSQNWIGGTLPGNARFVPPPPAELPIALGDLEQFMHADDAIPPILKAGMIHAQFEVIHPFLDGNGRTGRMLITIYLWHEGCLEKPVLFLSSYFKEHQQVYYDRLGGYHQGKAFEWLDFYLDGVIAISQEAILMADQITALREKDMTLVQGLGKRSAESAIRILTRLFAQPIVNVKTIQDWTNFTRDGAYKTIARLVDLGILVPKDIDIKYGQSYIYKDYIKIFADYK